MSNKYIAEATTTINAPAAKVWDALTRPELIKQYLFGTQVTTDWRVGSPITYEGVWEGKAYKDKGKILQVEPGKLLVSSYWSALSGLPDVPENYQTVRYELAAEGKRSDLAELTAFGGVGSITNATLVFNLWAGEEKKKGPK